MGEVVAIAYLQPGSSALFVLVRESTPDRMLPEVSEYGGTVLHTWLSQDAQRTRSSSASC
jgi:uncharacterized membrane protein